MNEFSEFWQRQKFDGMRSYTRTRRDELVLRMAHAALTDCFFTHFDYVTAGRRFARVVDIACGTGDWSRACLAIADQVLGIDINPDFVRVARQRSEATSPSRLLFEVGDMSDFDDFDGADLVLFAACLSYLDEAALLAILKRTLAKMHQGGIIYVRASIAHPRREPYRGPIGYYRSREQYDALFASLGLRTLSSIDSNVLVASEFFRAALDVPRRSTREQLIHGLSTTALELGTLRRRRNRFHNWILQCPRSN